MSTVQDKLEIRVSAPGSLPRPGPVGRIFRLAMGALAASGALQPARGRRNTSVTERLPRSLTFWLYVLIAFHITPYVVNIGFGMRSTGSPRIDPPRFWMNTCVLPKQAARSQIQRHSWLTARLARSST
jgi:hypothetical protein